jgi:DNA-binding NtrC family response regulator
MFDRVTNKRRLSTMNGLEPQSIPEHILFGRSKIMQEIQQAVQNVADASVPILLQGERGTGKEVIGREIHRRSRWQSGPFTKVEAATQTLPSRNQGIHSNRDSSSRWWTFRGRSSNGARGTLFFDDIDDLDPVLQAKLLEFFQEDQVSRFSDGSNNPAYPRVICATRSNLERNVAAGRFRLDLFYRINVVTIQLPSLRDRKEDIPELAKYFFEVSSRRKSDPCRGISTELLHIFCNYHWPGNIRELENCVKICVALDGGAAYIAALLSKGTPPARRGRSTEQLKKDIPLRAYRREIAEEAERNLIYQVLTEKRWNRREAAKALQVSYQTLLHKLRQAGLSKKREPLADGSDKPIPEDRLP